MTQLSLAYSPDTDDAFMLQALQDGLVAAPDLEFVFTSDEIQKLNLSAQEERFDICALSAGAYPLVQDKYLIMPVGMSIGEGYGPAVIVADGSPIKNILQLSGQRVAVPGLQTSATLALRLLAPEIQAVEVPFEEVSAAVVSRHCVGGLLLHEDQMLASGPGWRRIGNLGLLWQEKTGEALPLGINVIKRSLGSLLIQRVNRLMQQSIVYGLEHRQETLRRALQASGRTLNQADGERYISMFVNNRSCALEPDIRQAIVTFLNAGAAAGLLPPLQPDREIFAEQARQAP